MQTRRTFALATLVLGLASVPAVAVETKPFSKDAFDAAQKAGEPILLEVHASWCPVCKAQEPILKSILEDRKFSKVRVFQVNYDTDKDILKALGVQKQSTLIAFKGMKETARSVGDTYQKTMAELVSKAL